VRRHAGSARLPDSGTHTRGIFGRLLNVSDKGIGIGSQFLERTVVLRQRLPTCHENPRTERGPTFRVILPVVADERVEV
jgi:hypothetical protein